MFAAIGDMISIIDLQDPVDIKEVARITGLSKGTLYTGRNKEVFFEDSESNWWELDVDQVLPAISLENIYPDFKLEALKAHEQNQDTFLSNISSIQEQIEEVFTWIGFSYPIESHATGSDLFIGVHSGSEWGGGQIVRLKTDVSNGPELYSTFRTFTPIKLDYENGRVFAGYAFETASELSIISVEDIESPIYENSIYIHSNAFKSIDNQLYIGARGLSQMNGDQNFELRGQAKPIDGKTDYLNQLIFDEERALIYGLRGAQNPSGLAIYSIADPTAPQFISTLDINGPFQMTYLQNKIYGFRSGYNETNPELLVVDVTDPLMPELEGVLELDDRVIGVHAWLGQSNKPLLALLTARTGLRIWEISDPAQPVELISIKYPEQCQMPENDPRYEIPFSRQLFFLNEHLVSPIGICGNFKIDVSSPTSAQIIGPFPYSGATIFEDGYLFTGGTNLKIYQLDEQER